MRDANVLTEMPTPYDCERPTAYADRLGQWYATLVSAEHKKRWGQYLTPVPVADFMASLCQPEGEILRILDPGAGAGVLTCALCEHLASQRRKPCQLMITAYEVDKDLCQVLEKGLSYLQLRLGPQGISVEFTISMTDFIIQHADGLDDSLSLFPAPSDERFYDVVICNPPYFKLPKSDARALAAAAVVHGQPNIYALFMAVSVHLLSPAGEFVFITPRSFTSGPYFRLFREKFFAKMRPETIHVFTSRREAFRRDQILQENIILKARRMHNWGGKATHILVSSSTGTNDFSAATPRRVSLSSVLDLGTTDKVLRIPATEEEEALAGLIDTWPGSLRAYGLEISTGPVVPFRAVSLLSDTGDVPYTHAPLLWMHNVRPMDVVWPVLANRKEQYIRLKDEAKPLLVPNRNYVLVRRFSAKEERRRLTAAPFLAESLGSHFVGLENHLNYVHRPHGTLTDDEAWGLAILYNSPQLDTYYRVLNGNTQVSATELRALPLPPLEVITDIGRRAKALSSPLEHIGSLVAPTFHAQADSS